ncbi:Polysaccharide pyruvyl transferase [Pilibacter termitis]|uniref:Polysaccharide pyruvyl transferase n=1 Tax=Pilibacter termitis TaxID=263852 RepID=A0A1T4QZP4_9ENTE|nr:polysaccharide pyruvyl transferase family protein [Pilibacter termitis]SKA09210.1 Polysaccharide pyruvyl transferase [Pilibacter termitis]
MNKKLPKILFYTPTYPWDNYTDKEMIERNLISGNTGNLLFGYSAVNLFDVPKENFVRVWDFQHDKKLQEEEYDYFVLPMANGFRNGNIEELTNLTKVAEKVKTSRIILCGVGGQFGQSGFGNLAEEILEAITTFTTTILKKAKTIGVRDIRTFEFLTQKIGLQENQVDVIGCPSIRYFGPQAPKMKEYQPWNDDFKIAVNYTPGEYHDQWARFIDKIFREKEKSFAIMQDLEEGELLLNHKRITTFEKMHDLLPTRIDHPIIRNGRARIFGTPDSWYGSMKTFDFSIGTRIHGNVAPLLMGVPSMTIAIDSRVEGLAKYFNMPYIWFDEIKETTTVEELYYRALAEMPKFYETFDEKYDEYINFFVKNGVSLKDMKEDYVPDRLRSGKL